ncbi:hypothetical protein CPB83DRAFT_920308, partial [Crepidotus variabilis]
LQKLVIRRLFELQKMNLSRTGYRLRSHIAKALQRRCKAIRRAVKRYNAIAVKLTPPQATLDWSQVSHYVFLEEFELLRGSRQDLVDKRWANASIRLALKQDLRIQRAKEEITICNREIRRVHTGIHDEHIFFARRLEELKNLKSPIYHPVLDYVKRQKGVNFQILARLRKIHEMPGFTGDPTPGIKKGGASESPVDNNTTSLQAVQVQQELEADDSHLQAVDDDLDDLDDEHARDVVQMIDYVAELPRQND